MRGIPEDKAVEIGEQIDSCKYLECSVKEWLRDECQELNPWIPLEEFLKSGFEGLCWVQCANKNVTSLNYFYGRFLSVSTGHQVIDNIIKVQPIHKPEPPRC